MHDPYAAKNAIKTEHSDRHCVIVDDVRPYRDMLKKWFEEWGFRCSVAARAIDAWQAVLNDDVDLVVTDIDMPGISGLDLIRSIRASDALRNRIIPVIAISSLQDDDIDLITQQVGAIRFTPKPLDKNEFHNMVAAVLNSPAENATIKSATSDHPAARQVSPRLRRLLTAPNEKLSKGRRKH